MRLDDPAYCYAHDKDVMGYPLSAYMDQFRPQEISAAKALATAAGYEWDCVGTDPRVTGQRFLVQARVVLATVEGRPVRPIMAFGSNDWHWGDHPIDWPKPWQRED